MHCCSKSPEASQRVGANSDPETAANLVAAATVSDGCGCVSLRGGLLSASGAAGRNGIAAVKDLLQCSAVPILAPPRPHLLVPQSQRIVGSVQFI